MFPEEPLDIIIEAAFGADRRRPQDWEWTDLTSRWRADTDITATTGRSEGAQQAEASSIQIELRNNDGHLTPDDPRSPYWPYVDEGLPMRITVDPGVGDPLVLAGFAASIAPRWPSGTSHLAVVPIEISGVMREYGRGESTIASTPRRWIPRQPACIGYWPCDEGELTTASRAIVGRQPLLRMNGPMPQWGSGELADWLPSGISMGADRLVDMLVTWDYPVAAVGVEWACDWVMRAEGNDNAFRVLMLGHGDGDELPRDDWLLSSDGDTITLSGVFNATENDSTTFISSFDAPMVFDGRMHHLRFETRNVVGGMEWAFYIDGAPAVEELADYNTQRISGWRIYTEPDAELAFGHLAAYATHTVDGPAIWDPELATSAVFYPPTAEVAAAAAMGHRDETASTRVERLCAEEAIPLAVIGAEETLAADSFPSAVEEGEGWGVAETGQPWQTWSQNIDEGDEAEFTVTDGTATVTSADDGGTEYAAHLDGLTIAGDWDITALVELSADSSIAITAQRGEDPIEDQTISGILRHLTPDGPGEDAPGIAIAISHPDVGTGTVQLTRDLQPGQPYWIRLRKRGLLITMRYWEDGVIEPPDWDLDISRNVSELSAGFVGVSGGIIDADAEVKLHDFQVTAADPGGTPMGPQRPATLLDILHEAELAEDGILYEDGFGLGFRTRRSRYNQPVMLELDAAERELGLPFEPTRDDQRYRNQWTIDRTSGDSATATDETSQAQKGPRDDSLEVNYAADTQLPDRASWELNKSTTPRMRYPHLSAILHASPSLVEDVMAIRLGDRVQAHNLPPQHPRDLDQVVEGMTHTIRRRRQWFWDAIVSPADPWEVGTYGPELVTPGLHIDGAPGGFASTDTARVRWGSSIARIGSELIRWPVNGVLQLTGDMDLRAHIRPEDWTRPVQTIVTKFRGALDERQFIWRLNEGFAEFWWSSDGTDDNPGHSEAPIPASLGQSLFMRVTMDADNGNDEYEVTHFVGDSIDGPWHQTGPSAVGGGAAQLHQARTHVEVGSREAGGQQWLIGEIYRVQIRGDIDGPVLTDADFTVHEDDARTFVDDYGHQWDVHGSAQMRNPLPPKPTDRVRWDTDTCTIAHDIDLTGTDTFDVEVRTHAGPRWTTDPTQWVDGSLHLQTGGVVVEVENIADPTGNELDFVGESALEIEYINVHYAPSVESPAPGALLICAWQSSWEGHGSDMGYTLDGPMEMGAMTGGALNSWAVMIDAHEVLEDAGDTGTRLAWFSTLNRHAALSIVAHSVASSRLVTSEGGYASTANQDEFDVEGSLDVRIDATLPEVDDGLLTLAAQWDLQAGERGWALHLTSDGYLALDQTPDGQTIVGTTASEPLTEVGRRVVRCTAEANGSNSTIRYFVGSGMSGPWTQIGTDQVISLAEPHQADAPVSVGSYANASTPASEETEFHRFWLMDEIGGEPVIDLRLDRWEPGDISHEDQTGWGWALATASGGAEVIAGAGGNTPTVQEHHSAFVDEDVITITTSEEVHEGAWLIAIQGWDWDPNDEFGTGPEGLGWEELAVSPDMDPQDVPRIGAWAREVTQSGPQTVTFPVADPTDDHHARLYVLSDFDGASGQIITAHRVGHVAKEVATGTNISLAYPARYAL